SCGGGQASPVSWSASAHRQVSTGPELLSEMVVLMAGRAAELSVLGSASTLSEADHARAEEIAELVVRAGLGTGPAPDTAPGLVSWAGQEAAALVGGRRAVLEQVAAALRASGAMFIDEVEALVKALPAE